MKNNQMKHGLWTSVVASILMTATLASCGKSKDSDEGSEETSTGTVSGSGGSSSSSISVAADSPIDSTGVLSTVSLGFGTIVPASTLALQSSTTLDVGGGIVLSDARVSIGSIKIKANKEMNESEKAFKKSLEDEKKSRDLASEEQKKALELEKEAVQTKYDPLFEAAADTAEKDALKVQMKAEEGLVEEKLAALEAVKEAEVDAIEAQRDGNLKWAGPYVYSLIDNSVAPVIPEAQLVDGSYKRIEFKIKPNRSLDGSDPLLNNAIYLAGNVTLNGVVTPFTASFRIDEEFKLMGAGSLKIDPSATNALKVAFDPMTWFSTVDFSAATVDTTGTIVVSQVSNPVLWELMRKNIKRSTKFGEDEDGDGQLKEEEAEGDGDEAETEAEATEAQ